MMPRRSSAPARSLTLAVSTIFLALSFGGMGHGRACPHHATQGPAGAFPPAGHTSAPGHGAARGHGATHGDTSTRGHGEQPSDGSEHDHSAPTGAVHHADASGDAPGHEPCDCVGNCSVTPVPHSSAPRHAMAGGLTSREASAPTESALLLRPPVPYQLPWANAPPVSFVRV